MDIYRKDAYAAVDQQVPADRIRPAKSSTQVLPRVWCEIGNGEHKRFLSTIFTLARLCSDAEMAIRKTYVLCALVVSPRVSDQRAPR